MKIKELRAMSADALKARLVDLRLELAIENRNIKQTGVASKKVQARSMRRTIAQILTLLKERGATV